MQGLAGTIQDVIGGDATRAKWKWETERHKLLEPKILGSKGVLQGRRPQPLDLQNLLAKSL
jgi:hypothetical protein